jgi:hypothetical protein
LSWAPKSRNAHSPWQPEGRPNSQGGGFISHRRPDHSATRPRRTNSARSAPLFTRGFKVNTSAT